MKIDHDLYARRVARGAAFMDKTHPGWHQQVNLGLLDMADGSSCIIGQTLGREEDMRHRGHDSLGYSGACEVYGHGHDAWESEHGFNVETRLQDGRRNEEEYDLLQKLWEVQVHDRLIADLDRDFAV